MKNDFIINSSLLDERGLLKEEFVSCHEIKKYDRSMVKYNKLSIKESDTYLFEDDKYFLMIVIGDHSLYSYLEVTLYDKINHSSWHKRYQELLTFGSISLPPSFRSGNTIHHHKNFDIEIENTDINKIIKFHINSLSVNAHFDAEFIISGDGKSLVFTKGNETKKEFIYKADTTLLSVSGTFTFGPLKHTFNKAKANYIFKRGNEKKLKGINLFCLHKDKVIDINLVDNVLVDMSKLDTFINFNNVSINKNNGGYYFSFDNGGLMATPIRKIDNKSNHLLARINGTISNKNGASISLDEIGLIFLL